MFAGGEETPIVVRGTTVPEAHQAYLRGRHLWNQRTGESIGAAIEEFESAIELDSTYADAWSGLADSYLWYPTYASVSDSPWVAQGYEAAETAVALAGRSGMARTSLALARLRSGQWESAEREFEQAIELSPGYASAYQWTGLLFRMTGRGQEAVVAARRAVEIDPVSQSINEALAVALLIARRVDEAIDQYQRTIALNRSWRPAWRDLTFALLDAGAFDDALAAHLNWARLHGADSVTAREFVEAVARYKEIGEAQRFSFPADYPLSLGFQAVAYAATGQRERALELVESWVQEGDFREVATRHIRGTRGTRDLLGDDPRYQALLEEAGITW